MTSSSTTEPSPAEEGETRGERPAALRPRLERAPDSWWLPAVAIVLWLSTVVAHVLSPALPGWRAGIERTIITTDRIGAILSQVGVVAGCLLAFGLLIETLKDSRLSIGYRVGISPFVAAVITTAMAAATRPLPILLALVLSVLTAIIALTASVPTLMSEKTRGLGMVLGLAGIASVVNASARLLALRASQEALASLFDVARTLATIAMVLELGAWLIGMAWLSAKNVRRLAVFLGIAVFVAVAVGLMAAAGKSYDAGPWTVLASRAVGELTRHPRPFGPEMLRSVVELLELVGAATALASRSRGNVACTALGLALLARSATDIPILALGLCLAALAGPLARVEPKVEPKEGAEGLSAPSTTPQ